MLRTALLTFVLTASAPIARAQPAPAHASTWTDVSAERLPTGVLGGRNMDVEYADLDRDGDLDLIVAQEFGPNLVLGNDGSGVFSVAGVLPAKDNDSEDIAVADFDGDGTLDLAIASEDNQIHELYLGSAETGLVDASDRLTFRTTSNAILALDADRDGDVDLLLGNNGSNTLLLNDGGRFRDVSASHLPQVQDVTQDIEAGDLNGDGLTDLVFANEDANRLLLGRPDGTFAPAPNHALPLRGGDEITREADLGDVDSDGDLDLFLANVDLFGQQRATAANRLLLNDGRGHFADAPAGAFVGAAGHTFDADLADVDGDGHLDLLLVHGFGERFEGEPSQASLEIHLGDGTGRFDDATAALVPPGLPSDFIDVELIDLGDAGGRVLYLTRYRGPDVLLAAPER